MSGQIPPPSNMQFSPFGTGQLSNPLAGSIDSLFNAYKLAQATKLQNAQIPGIEAATQGQLLANQGTAQAQAAAEAGFRLQNQGLTPQDVNQFLPQAMTPQPSMYGPGITPQQGQAAAPGAPMAAGQQMPLGPQAAQQQPVQDPNEDPRVGVLRNILAMHLQGAQLGAAQQGAALANTQSEAYQHTAEGNFQQAQADLFSAGGGIGTLADAVATKKMTPEQAFSSVSTRNGGALALATELARRGIDINSLNREAGAANAGAKGSAELTQGGSAQEMARAAQSAYKQFDLLQKASDNFSRSNNQLLNKPILEIKATASPEAQVLKTALSTARIEYARAASGSKSPSDTFMAEAKAALPDSITAAQITPVLNQLRNSLAEQAKGQLSPTGLGDVPALIPNAPKANQAPAPIMRTLKNGQTVKVIPLGGGRFQAVP